MKLSTLKRLIQPSAWLYNRKMFVENWEYDKQFNASFRGVDKLNRKLLRTPELRYIKLYRKCQVSIGSIWYYMYYNRLVRMSHKTGIGLYENLSIPKGIIIGHAGTIIVSALAQFEGNVLLTHNVTIGRDIRGKRQGAPKIGKNVSIRCNSTVVGAITIGEDVLIAPNTFVNVDIPAHSVALGSPAVIHHKDHATEGHVGVVNSEK